MFVKENKEILILYMRINKVVMNYEVLKIDKECWVYLYRVNESLRLFICVLILTRWNILL